MPPAPSIPQKRALPSKEAALFKELLSQYESRQFKKGQKNADQILKKFPEHGETMCMKGLILTHIGKREEGFELVKKGIRLDLTSHICWHVFGLIQKGEKNYEEALKSYMQALKFDKENINILRDAAHLQTQLRVFDALVDTRTTLLKLRPNARQHWIALAVAYHLNGNLLEAKKILEHYEYTLKNIPDYDVEHSETLLYHVRILEDMGETTEALAILDSGAKSRSIVDRTAIMTFRARLLSKQQSKEAEHAWRALIEQNPECYAYYSGFLSNQGINLDSVTDDNRSQALTILHDFSTQIPRALAPRRLALNIATGDQFKDLARTYLLSGLTKGIPSLFVDIKGLYSDEQKRQVVEDIVEQVRESLSSTGTLPAPHNQQHASSSNSSSNEPPTTYLWTLYFLAQHYSFLRRPGRALSLLDLALDHTPTLPELYTCKARVLKRAGDYLGASRCLDEARLLDGQDRFLNTKSVKYRLRAGLVQEANEILGLFTKKDSLSPGADLEDMQSMLYLIEEGNAHYRNGNLGPALKKYVAVQKVFDEVEDDQYDFHGYSLRKFTINIYLNLMSWEKTLRSHPAYVEAALSASRIFLSVHDNPSLIATPQSKETEAAKKAKKKAKKAAQKVQEEAKKAPAAPAAVEDKGLDAVPLTDTDADGSKLLASPDGLEKAAKLLSPLSTLAQNNIDTWITIYDVAVRRKKYLQAVKALNQARSLDADHPELHIRFIDFHKTVSSLPQPPPTPISPILTESLADLLPAGISLDTFNSQYLQRHSTSATAILAAAKVLRMLDSPRGEIEDVVFTSLGPEAQLDIPSAVSSIAFLSEIKSPRTDEFRAACDAKFELSTIFKVPTELAALRKQAVLTDIPGPEIENETEELSS